VWLKREKADLVKARTELGKKLATAKTDGASAKQIAAIKAEATKIDSNIASVNKSITTNLASQAAAIKAQIAAINASHAAAITADKQAIVSAFSNIITDAQTAFGAATQAYIADTLGPKYSQGGLLTAKEQRLADMQAADTAKSLVDGLGAAQKQLADDMNGSLIEHIVDVATGSAKDIFGPAGTPAQVALDRQAIDQAQRMIDENNLSINATADRTATDKAYANAVTLYQQQRTDAEHAMTRDLTDLGKGIADGTAYIGDLPGVLAKYGLTTGDIMLSSGGRFQDDMTNLGTATQALAKVMFDEAIALAALGDTTAAAGIRALADSIAWQTPVAPGQSSVTGGLGGASGYFMLNPVPGMATGGDILRDGLIYAHAGERVQPARVVRGQGGGSTIMVTVNAPNYVGAQADLARAIKTPALIEAVATAVLMGNRRGHIRKDQLT